MDGQNFSQLVSMLVKAIQAYCNGHVQFRSCVEVIGHVHLNIDGSVKVDYVLSEEVSKAVSDSGPSFSSHSYLSQPPHHISDISRQFRENPTPSSHSSAQTLPPLNSDPACVNTSTSQRMPIGGTQSVVVHMDGSGEAAVASDQMQVTVSFDGSSVLPIIKQETNVNESEGSILPETDRQAVQEHFLMDCQEATASQVSIPSALSYREEDKHPAALYSQDSPRSSVSYSHTQEDGQLRTVYSQNTQPVVTGNNLERLNQSPMIQIQEVHSEALPPVVICPQQNAQPADCMDHLQERYPSRTLQTSVLPTSPPRDSSRPSVSYLQGTGLLQSEQTLQGPVDSHHPSHVSSSDHFQSSATNMSCSTDTGSDTQFGSLCLDVVPMKEEVMDEMPPSPHGSSYPVESGQERELPDFSNVVIETLGRRVEGTQLIVVREGMQQPQPQPLPFPVLLHAHPGLSPSASPDEVDVRDVPFPVSASGLAVPSCSSTDLPSALSPTTVLGEVTWKSSPKRRPGFQPGNQCWKLQERWKKAAKTRKRHQQKTTPDPAVSSDNTGFKTLSSTRQIKVNNEKSEGSLERIKGNSGKLHICSSTGKKLSSSPKIVNRKGSHGETGSPKTASIDAKLKRRNSAGTGSPSPKQRAPTHILKKVPWTDQKKQPRKICIVCREKGLFPLSCYFCPRCPKQPGYCRIRNCFTSYHSKMGLKYVSLTA